MAALTAGIDIGTNTILLLVARVAQGSVQEVLEDHVRVVRLGQGVDKNKVFHPEALERARACFAEYAKILQKYPQAKVFAAATSGSRDAKNSREFFAEVKLKYGIAVEVISGGAEAEYSFRGALSPGQNPQRVAVLDIGGGSTEIVCQTEAGLTRASMNIGCVRLTEKFLSDPPTPQEEDRLREFVRENIASVKEAFAAVGDRELIGVAGTPTYLSGAILGLSKFQPDKIHGSRIEYSALCNLRERLAKLPARERIGIGGMDSGRADVIIAGAIILEEVLRELGKADLFVSIRGLRYGLAMAAT